MVYYGYNNIIGESYEEKINYYYKFYYLFSIFLVLVINNKSSNASKLNSSKDIADMMKEIHKDDLLPETIKMKVNLKDKESVKAYTGLNSSDNIKYIYVREPSISSIPYSAIAIKVKDKSKINDMKQEILNNIDMNKWICVSAEKLYITSYNDIIFVVMSYTEYSDKIYDNFSKYVNNKQDKKLVKEASEIELPDEMLG